MNCGTTIQIEKTIQIKGILEISVKNRVNNNNYITLQKLEIRAKQTKFDK